jgi:hypothetical protein
MPVLPNKAIRAFVFKLGKVIIAIKQHQELQQVQGPFSQL